MADTLANVAPRVLIVGADWIGDSLRGCVRAAKLLGADVRVVPTNQPPQRGLQIRGLQERVYALPFVGGRLARALQTIIRASILEEVERRLEDALRMWRPAVLLALVDGWYDVFPHVMQAFPHVHKIAWMMDDPFFLSAPHTFDLAAFDRLLTVEASLVAPLRAATGRPVANLPLAADHEVYRPLGEYNEHDESVAFIGKSYRNQPVGLARGTILSRVASLGLEIWGDDGWKGLTCGGVDLTSVYKGGPISSEEANLVYNRCAMAVCIHHPQIRCGTTLRSFAICAAGAFQLLEDRPGLSDWLEPGREVVTFGCGEELAECIRRYRVYPAERRRVAAAGQARVRGEHTYVHRMRHILKDFLSA